MVIEGRSIVRARPEYQTFRTLKIQAQGFRTEQALLPRGLTCRPRYRLRLRRRPCLLFRSWCGIFIALGRVVAVVFAAIGGGGRGGGDFCGKTLPRVRPGDYL